MNRDTASGTRAGFTILYPLAFLGAHLAFMPLLLLLLPRRVESITQSDPAVPLSVLLLSGGIVASVAHIAAGRWSDGWMARHGSRRAPVAVGLLALAASYAGLAAADSLAALLAAVLVFQFALNLMFAPLGALLADYVDDRNKARTTAWLALALPVSIAAAGGIATAFPADGNGAFVATAAAVLLCVIPLLFAWPHAPAETAPPLPSAGGTSNLPLADFRYAWIARLLVQCGAALVLHYLYVYLAQLPATSGRPARPAEAVAALLFAGSVAGILATISAGQLSDRLSIRRLPIAVAAMLAGTGLLILAIQPQWPAIVVGYCLFSAGLMAFLSVDSAMVAQMVGRSAQRGKWLGVMNLTNTLPAILVPALALGAVQVTTGRGLSLMIAAAAIGAGCAALLVMRIRSLK